MWSNLQLALPTSAFAVAFPIFPMIVSPPSLDPELTLNGFSFLPTEPGAHLALCSKLFSRFPARR